jgi:hypothetical protein
MSDCFWQGNVNSNEKVSSKLKCRKDSTHLLSITNDGNK